MKNASMKKNTVVALAVMSIFAAANVAHAAITTQTATATWSASASKASTAALSVSSDDLSSDFVYSAASGFVDIIAPFTLKVTGEGSATAFKLVASTPTDNVLSSADVVSTLTVAVKSGGTTVVPAGTTVYDSTTATHDADYDNLGTAYTYNGETDVASKFTLSVGQPTSNGAPVPFFALPNTTWSGDVKIDFTATWTVPV